MTNSADGKEAFAIVRIDLFSVSGADTNWRNAVTVTRVVPTQDDAESEVTRLNQLNRSKECVYFWQHTRGHDARASRGDVFVVQHVHEIDEDDQDVKLIGVYDTEDRANAAVARLSQEPGFRASARGFHVTRFELDKDHWTEGFVTVRRGDE